MKYKQSCLDNFDILKRYKCFERSYISMAMKTTKLSKIRSLKKLHVYR